MNIDFDEQTNASLAAARAALAEAEAAADAYARDELDSVSARVSALREKRARLGAPPVSASYATAADWTRARDQHIFDAEHCDRDLAEAEQRLGEAQTEHARLLAPLPALRLEIWRLAIAALDRIAASRLQEAANLATLRQSLLVRVPMDHWPVVNQAIERRSPDYVVRSGGFPDVSFVNATVQTDGFTPDKSAALVAELGLAL